MAKKTARLTAKTIEKANTPGNYPDGDGLYLQVAGATSKSWLYRYTLQGKQRWAGLGSARDGGLTLAEARAARDDLRAQVRRGVDPVAVKRQGAAERKLTEVRSVTFREAATQCIATMRPEWGNIKHATQWDTTLRTYAYPTIGDLPVAAIDTQSVLKILQPIWAAKTETAKRLRGRVERVLDWASSAGFRAGENPARWRGHLDNLLATPSRIATVKHHAAMPYAQVGAFMVDLQARDGIAARALEFAVLTAARTNETLGATWAEIDFAEKAWTVPGSRMKSGREHRVPLSDAALAVLARVRGVTTHHEVIFPNLTAGRPLSNMAMLKQLERMGHPELTVHGFRSTFRDWGAERTNFPRELLEAALAHVVGDKTERAYQRGDLFEKRRRLMAAWAEFCAKPAATGSVVPMRAKEAAQ